MKIKHLFIFMLIGVLGVISVFSLNALVVSKPSTKPTLPTVAEIEDVDAATANITEVQTRLKKWGYYTGKVDGINGPLTIAAVKKFQKKYGLTQDGIVGPLTAAKMGISVV